MNTKIQQPDTQPDHHEASREAFEKAHPYASRAWSPHTFRYRDTHADALWTAWTRALDWQASQQATTNQYEISRKLADDESSAHLSRLCSVGPDQYQPQQISSPEGQRAPCPEAGNDGDALACPPSGVDCIEPQPDWRPLIKGERAQTGDKIAVLLGGMRDPQPWDWPHVEGTHQSFWRTRRSIADAPIAVKTIQDEPEWRPLEPGEIIQEGDEILRDGTGPWEHAKTCLGLPWGDYIYEGRTRRPKPTPAICQACEKPTHHAGVHTCITPEPEPEWRPLEPGEKAVEGDQVSCQHGGPWSYAQESVGHDPSIIYPDLFFRTRRPKPTPTPEPQGSAVEWVKERLAGITTDPSYPQDLYLPDDDALELAKRCDAAENKLEREQMRLAACGVVALSDTPEYARH